MTAIVFPSNPTIGDTFTASGKEWEWDGTAWQLLNVTTSLHASTHGNSGSDKVTLAQSQITGLSSSLSAKAPIASPTFTGTPSAPTAVAGTNTTQLATTEFVGTAIDAIDALPTQTGNGGKFLGTDGSAASWQTVDALPSQTGNDGKYLTTNGTSASWQLVVTDPMPSIFLMMGA